MTSDFKAAKEHAQNNLSMLPWLECKLCLRLQAKPALQLKIYGASCSNYFMLIPKRSKVKKLGLLNLLPDSLMINSSLGKGSHLVQKIDCRLHQRIGQRNAGTFTQAQFQIQQRFCIELV